MLTARNLDLATASLGLATYNLGGVFGVLVWAVLVTMLGSRGPLLSGALACAGSALALLLVPLQAQGSHTLLIVVLGLNGLLANAVQVSMYALAAHVYPTSVRATGVAYLSTVGRAGDCSVHCLALPSFRRESIGRRWPSPWFGAFAGLAWVRGHFPGVGRLEVHRAVDIP
jgi:AAHS family 4-hydroxybenzoate transporter-like MFS transporter